MKINLGFFAAVVIVLAIYIPAVQAQARLTFSSDGSSFSITNREPITYTINNSLCSDTRSLLFVFQRTGNVLLGSTWSTPGTITFSINGVTAPPINHATSGITSVSGVITNGDLFIYNNEMTSAPDGSTVVLSAGTITATGRFNAIPPTNGIYNTIITDNLGYQCSNNGVSAGTTAASVSISGRVLTGNRRGLSNAVVYLTDSEGNTRTARTNSFGYYRFQDVQAGQSVTITIASKRYHFAPRVLNINEEMNGVNFLAEQ